MDALDLIRSFAALGFVIALIYAVGYVVKRNNLFSTAPIAAGNNRRIEVVESRTLDTNRKLVLVACDGAEHLVLLGQSGETILSAADPTDPTDPTPPASGALSVPIEAAPLPALTLGKWRTLSPRSQKPQVA